DVQTADTQRLPQVNPEFMSREGGNAEHDEYDNSLLDLDGVHGAQSLANDPVLDLDFETAPQVGGDFLGSTSRATSKKAFGGGSALKDSGPAPEAAFADTETDLAESVESHDVTKEVSAAPSSYRSDMPSEAIDEIARRVVEQLSDKVVREIAWEVVPELS